MDRIRIQGSNGNSDIVRTRKPKITGLITLCIGILSLIESVWIFVLAANQQDDFGIGFFIILFISIPIGIYAILKITGGIYILKRKRWKLALAILVIDVLVNTIVLAYFIFGGFFIGLYIDIVITTTAAIGLLLSITSMILIILSKNEFSTK